MFFWRRKQGGSGEGGRLTMFCGSGEGGIVNVFREELAGVDISLWERKQIGSGGRGGGGRVGAGVEKEQVTQT